MQPELKPMIYYEGTSLLVDHQRMHLGSAYYLILKNMRRAVAVKYDDMTMDVMILPDEDSTTEVSLLWNN